VPKCTDASVMFGKVGRRVVEAAFDGGDIVSDGGAPLLKLVDERIGLTRAATRVFADGRRTASVRHSIRSLIAQCVYGLCCGWEDVCDHNTLRHDLVWQTAVGRAEELASALTLSRLETSATMAHAVALHGVLLDQFIASRRIAPDELVLDIDATHMPLYGAQEGAHFHGHYDSYCCSAPRNSASCTWHPSNKQSARWAPVKKTPSNRQSRNELSCSRAPANELASKRRLPTTPAKWDPDTSLVGSLADEGGINSARLWVVMKRFFATVADQLTQDDPAFAEKLRRATPHWMRHTHATHALHGGADLTTVRDNLRHASLATTSMYLHSDDIKRASQMASVFGIPKG
jgi:hypothetical protein